ncbi:Fc.00g071570.m01.CDS01 [Cosmosporella sp. VM-42]
MSMSEVRGRKISCGGTDGPYSLEFTCKGADCSIFDAFPATNCTTKGDSLVCSNGISCGGLTTDLVTEFVYTQDVNDFFYLDRKIKLAQCEFSVAVGSNLTEPLIHSDTCEHMNSTTPTPSKPSTNSTAVPTPLVVSAGIRRKRPTSLHIVLLLLTFAISGALAGDVSVLHELKPRNTVTYEEKMEGFKEIWEDWYEGKLKDYMKGEFNKEDVIDLLTGGFVAEIQETACSAILDYVLDPIIEKYGLEIPFDVVLKPLTSKCARKVRRFARKFRSSMQLRLAMVFGGTLACDALEETVIDNFVPMHPDEVKSVISETICGSDEEGCEDVDVLSDASNCGKCGTKCPVGEQCIHGLCSMQYCNGMLFGSVADPCSPTCGCTSTPWGKGVCVQQEQCLGEVSSECESQDDCGSGEVCGMASGCDAFLCLNGDACIGQGPWLIPDESSSSTSSSSSSASRQPPKSTTTTTSSTSTTRSAGTSSTPVPGPNCRARVRARVDCQPTAHTGKNPRYRLKEANIVDVYDYANGEKVQHNGQTSGRWALVNPDPIFGSQNLKCWIPVLYLDIGRCQLQAQLIVLQQSVILLLHNALTSGVNIDLTPLTGASGDVQRNTVTALIEQFQRISLAKTIHPQLPTQRQQALMPPQRQEIAQALSPRRIYHWRARANHNCGNGIDVSISKGDIVKVLGRGPSSSQPSSNGVWDIQMRDGRIGAVQNTWLTLLCMAKVHINGVTSAAFPHALPFKHGDIVTMVERGPGEHRWVVETFDGSKQSIPSRYLKIMSGKARAICNHVVEGEYDVLPAKREDEISSDEETPIRVSFKHEDEVLLTEGETVWVTRYNSSDKKRWEVTKEDGSRGLAPSAALILV